MIATAMKNATPKRLAEAIRDIRKDAVMVDFSRVVCPQYGRMVEHFSALEGNPVSVHNNKTLFLEAIDIACRSYFSPMSPRQTMGETSNPKAIIDHVMVPYYEALALGDPSKYRMGRRTPAPRYSGTVEDAVAVELGLLATLDVGPINLRFGGHKEGQTEVFDHVWGAVHADGKWYDTDIFESCQLGETPEYSIVRDVEIEL